MNALIFQLVLEAIESRRTVAVVTDTDTGGQCILDGEKKTGQLPLSDDQCARIADMIVSDRSGMLGESNVFVRVYGPPLRMIVVGAVHIAQVLAPMAQLAGFDVTVIDPREGFATAGRMADFDTVTMWPDEGMELLKPDARTAVVTLTHDPKLDDPAIQAALKSDAFYIASLGSTRTHAKRLQRLRSDGFSDEQLSRIHGPAGLNIKALTPAEIAVSILSQAVAVRRGAIT